MFESTFETASPRCNSKRTQVATQGERCSENQLGTLRQQARIDVATDGHIPLRTHRRAYPSGECLTQPAHLDSGDVDSMVTARKGTRRAL